VFDFPNIQGGPVSVEDMMSRRANGDKLIQLSTYLDPAAPTVVTFTMQCAVGAPIVVGDNAELNYDGTYPRAGGSSITVSVVYENR
jgi:hypothetical protein